MGALRVQRARTQLVHKVSDEGDGMTRLIDADEIRWCDHFDSDGNKTKYKVAYSDEMPPTVDAEPVRHGKWIEYPIADGMNQCSVCGVLRFGESNYCPNCGARMDEE